MIAVLAVTAAFSMAAITSSHLRYAERYAFGDEALYLAEQGIADAVDTLHQNQSYGKAGQSMHLSPPQADLDYVISFQPVAGQLYSTNNFDGNSPDGCDGPGTVPDHAAHIVATGTAHGVSRTVDVIVAVPQFPYVVGVGGALQADNLLVRGAANMADFVAQEQGQSSPRPAEAAANKSINVTQGLNISGDILTPDVIHLPSNAVIGGTIRNGTTDLPDITISQFDPSGDRDAIHLDPTGGEINGSLKGLVGKTWAEPASGTLKIDGDLNVNNGILYVKGNLVVAGGITGTGAVLVEGSTTYQSATLDANNSVALLSGQDVKVTGSGLQSYFQGLVYTRQAFQASNITVAGTFVTGGGSTPDNPPPNGGMLLSNASVVSIPQTAAFQAQATINVSDLINGISWGQVLAGQPPSAAFMTLVVDPAIGASNLQPARQTILDNAVNALAGQPYHFVPGTGVFKANGTDLAQIDIPIPNGNVLRLGVWRGSDGVPFPWYSAYNPAQTPIQFFALSADTFASLAATAGVDVNTAFNNVVNIQNAALNYVYQYVPQGQLQSTTSYDFTFNKFLRDTMPMRIIAWKQRP